jgi:hypothetical protein
MKKSWNPQTAKMRMSIQSWRDPAIRPRVADVDSGGGPARPLSSPAPDSLSSGFGLTATTTRGMTTAAFTAARMAKESRQPREVSAEASSITITSCPMELPEIAALAAAPRRRGNQRLIMTPTGAVDEPACPRA